MVIRTRNLKRPRISPELAARTPPGQFPTQRWPVLHEGDIPEFDPATWDLRLFGLVEREVRLNWDQILALPRTQLTADFHCVSRWTTLDNEWEGVAAREILALAGVKPATQYVLFHAEGDYTANLPLAICETDNVLFAMKRNGEDLTPAHGYPIRIIAPTRYAWKSVKWVRGVELMAEDRLGYWEQYGYHTNADVWQEERFAE
jgi:DMSO/TMAO reductase YedYZ molybdopterin-dependent catalytic subunit